MEKPDSEELNSIDEDIRFERHRIPVDAGQRPVRLDRFLSERIAHTSRTKIQAGIEAGFVVVNGIEKKSNYKVQPGDEIVVSLPEPPRDTDVKPENIPLDIVFEDEHLMVVNKPPGMVVHPAHKNWTGTLVNALVWHFDKLPELPGNTGRPGLVHRIDKDTSGLLVIAKSEMALAGLAKQFYTHTIKRVYWALIWGIPEPGEGTIQIHLGRSHKDRRVTVAYPEGNFGKDAITHYRTLEALKYVALIECRLETGRTHQIRAHMAYKGNPIVGDTLYGGDQPVKGPVFSKYKQFVSNCFSIMNRQALHAKTLGFIHPVTKKEMFFESQLPADFQQVLDKWRRYTTAAE